MKPMQVFRNILVGVDRSNLNPSADIEIRPTNEAALNCALVLARYAQANLTVFSSLNAYPYLHDTVQTEFDHWRVEKEAKKLLGHLRRGPATLESIPRSSVSAPWEEICREVQRETRPRDRGNARSQPHGSIPVRLDRNEAAAELSVPRVDHTPRHRLEASQHPHSDRFECRVAGGPRVAVTCGEIVDARLHALHVLGGPGPPPPWYGHECRSSTNNSAKSDALRLRVN